jgi:5-methyltetrahydropteroyltriglutamate--homocysteine methyltransferase
VTTFRVEHVGSFVRPERLLAAARGRKAGTLTDAQLREIQDDCIRDIVAFQESIGLPTITDGEFRRRSWSAGFIDAVEGFGLRDGTLAFRDATRVIGVAASPYAKAPLRRRRRIVADDYRFLRSVVKRGVPKVTMAAPDVMHYFLGPKAFETSAYRDREAFFEALVKIYREEIADLAAEGCGYVQLDDTALPCNCDPHAREDVAARGEDADELTRRYAALFNECIRERPAGMAIGVHLCRGNLKGAWMAEGGYEPIADALFNRLDATTYCLEYDTERAGDFSPLRFVPKGKRVILGLVSTKTPVLESRELLKRRIDAAAKHVPLEQLGLGPQCGFSSGGGGGQALTQDDTRRKLQLIMETATEVWGNA